MKNKKIGIISVDVNTPMFNYGAILHTWAFEKFLEKNNYNNFEVLNYYPESIQYQNRLFPIFDLFTNCHRKLSLKYTLHYIQYLKKYFAVNSFFKNKMKISKKKYRYSKISKDILDYDILIAEDDVIWAPYFLNRKELVDKTFFLAHDNMKKCKKIAYAPSMAQCNFNKEDYNKIKEYLNGFDFISVRESYQKTFIKEAFNIDTTLVLDAVFLLDSEDYTEIISDKFKNRKYVFLYLPADDNIYLRESAKEYAIQNKLEIIEISNRIISKKNVFGSASVEDFLSGIKYADCVFTNSFHAICFSIIFEKEFYAFTRKASGKVIDICDRFCLSNRYYKDVCKDFSSKIDYSYIGLKKRELEEYSRKWLLHALNEVINNE